MKLLLSDNNDSFTYNIVGLLKSVWTGEIDVVKTNSLRREMLSDYDKIILSPGPGVPSEFPMMKETISFCLENNVPLLGICLGHQAIGEYFGGILERMPSPFHGFQEQCFVDNSNPLFKNMPQEIEVGLYHSWKISEIPPFLKIIGTSSHDIIMAISHEHYKIFGIQFHPESFMTKNGQQIVKNFLSH